MLHVIQKLTELTYTLRTNYNMFKNHGHVFKQKHKRCTCPTLKVNLYLFKI